MPTTRRISRSTPRTRARARDRSRRCGSSLIASTQRRSQPFAAPCQRRLITTAGSTIPRCSSWSRSGLRAMAAARGEIEISLSLLARLVLLCALQQAEHHHHGGDTVPMTRGPNVPAVRASWSWLAPYVPFVALTIAYLVLRSCVWPVGGKGTAIGGPAFSHLRGQHFSGCSSAARLSAIPHISALLVTAGVVPRRLRRRERATAGHGALLRAVLVVSRLVPLVVVG